jgi:hypothetical protein
MLIPTKRRCKKKHVIGGAGIFDTLLKRITESTAAKAIASVAKTALGKKAIEAGKTVVKEVGLKAIDVGKDVVIAKAKALLDGRSETILTQKSKDTLASLINNSSVSEVSNINGGAISIQDLVKRLNTGSGLRLA